MAQTRNIINDFRFEISEGNRKCDVSSEHAISKGEKHFAYEKGSWSSPEYLHELRPRNYSESAAAFSEHRKRVHQLRKSRPDLKDLALF